MLRLASLLRSLTLAGKQVQKNFHSVSTEYPFLEEAQFNANQASEDRLAYQKLKSLPAFVASVFDGHGGSLCAQYASTHLHRCLDERLSNNLKLNLPIQETVEISLIQAYQDVENGFLSVFKQNIKIPEYRRVGSCALSAVILKDSIHIANSGDCEGLLLSSDLAEPTNERLNAGESAEMTRLMNKFQGQADIIVNNGSAYYVKGRLQPTHSFGDFYLKYKQYNFTNLATFTGPYIESHPIISHFPLTEKTSHLILATDGVWDQISAETVKDIHSLNPPQFGLAVFKQVIGYILHRTNLENIAQLSQLRNRRNLHDDITLINLDLQRLRGEL